MSLNTIWYRQFLKAPKTHSENAFVGLHLMLYGSSGGAYGPACYAKSHLQGDLRPVHAWCVVRFIAPNTSQTYGMEYWDALRADESPEFNGIWEVDYCDDCVQTRYKLRARRT